MATIPPRVIPRAVKAGILRAAAASPHARTALPTIAANHELTLNEVRSVVEAHGWPRPESMLRAAAILERQAAGTSDDNAPEPGHEKLVQIQVHLLNADPDNIRTELTGIEELADSILATGLLQPIVARRAGGRLVVVVVAGHRRLAAVRRLGWTEVACIVRENMRPDQVLAAMLIENGQRAGLDPIEEARALRLLRTRDELSDVQIAKIIGRSQPYVSNRLALLDLSPSAQEAIRAGTLSLAAGATTGRKIAGTHREGGHASTAYLSETHPLAELVQTHCQNQGHGKNGPGRVGKIACGHCWEDIIRADERRQVEQRAAVSA